jgi:hypothetical protein
MSENQEKNPSLVFLFEKTKWISSIDPLCKLELIDIIPDMCTQFFYDSNIPAFVMTISKDKWMVLSDTEKFRIKTITRRIKENCDGFLTDAERKAYEESDPFEEFAQQQKTLESVQEQVESNITLNDIIVEEEEIDLDSIKKALE